MSELESNFSLLNARGGDTGSLCRGSMSAADCRALSLRCYSAAGTITSHPHKALLTAMGRTWVQLANQIDRFKLLQETPPQSRDPME
jgi:hypothetical protein